MLLSHFHQQWKIWLSQPVLCQCVWSSVRVDLFSVNGLVCPLTPWLVMISDIAFVSAQSLQVEWCVAVFLLFFPSMGCSFRVNVILYQFYVSCVVN